jgi:hypothetical protein
MLQVSMTFGGRFGSVCDSTTELASAPLLFDHDEALRHDSGVAPASG